METVTIAPNPGFPLTLGYHMFRASKDKQLEHLIDGELRATVPPEGFADYVKAWPQCADVVRSLTRAPLAQQATTLDTSAATAAAAAAIRNAQPL